MRRKKILILIIIGLMLENLFTKSVIYAEETNPSSEGVTQIEKNIEWEGTDTPENYKGVYRLYEDKSDLKIDSIEDLVNLSKDVANGKTYEGKNITLENDLDFEDDASYEDPKRTDYQDLNGDGTVQSIKEELTNKESGKGFTPIGPNEQHVFSGNFYGQNYTIKNLYINMSASATGFFGCVKKSEIHDLKLTGTMNSGTVGYMGSIAAYIQDCIVDNCHSSVNINITNYHCSNIGGIVGLESDNCKVINCSNSGKISFKQEKEDSVHPRIGGIVGVMTSNMQFRHEGGYILNCNNSGEIDVDTTSLRDGIKVGGIVGEFNGGREVDKCYNTGNVNVSCKGGSNLVQYIYIGRYSRIWYF